jgi:uncharacterized protein YjeT (DUF2065 family)
MLSAILWGAGLVLVIEGLVFALAPSRLEDLLRVLANIPVETRRIIGFVAVCRRCPDLACERSGWVVLMLGRSLCLNRCW